MSEFDVNGYNSHECDIHNHGYYLGAQSQQAKIDELQKQVITQGQNFNDQAQKLKILNILIRSCKRGLMRLLKR